METYIAVAVIFLIVGLAAWYVVKAKKSGKKCIGCPDGGCNCGKETFSSCSGSCTACAGCSEEPQPTAETDR